eukprot:gene12905-biopygen15539
MRILPYPIKILPEFPRGGGCPPWQKKERGSRHASASSAAAGPAWPLRSGRGCHVGWGGPGPGPGGVPRRAVAVLGSASWGRRRSSMCPEESVASESKRVVSRPPAPPCNGPDANAAPPCRKCNVNVHLQAQRCGSAGTPSAECSGGDVLRRLLALFCSAAPACVRGPGSGAPGVRPPRNRLAAKLRKVAEFALPVDVPSVATLPRVSQ